MLRLLLFRHAKASWDEPSLPDEKRPLTERGRNDAAAMGERLAAGEKVPDIVLCSHARRARQTLDLALPHWRPAPEVRTTPGLYGADDGYLEIIRMFGEGERLMLVGHNPAMEDTARMLTGQGSETEIARLSSGFKTGAVAVIDFDVAAWADTRPKSGVLVEYLTPR